MTLELCIFDPDAWAERSAAALAGLITDAIAARGSCRVALAGGGTPAPVYQRLATADLDVAKVRWFWGDERAVPPDDDSSNYAMARRTLLDPIGASFDNVHRMRGELAPDAAVADYVEQLGEAPIDVMLLGMGGDGHTASLFPSTDMSGDARVLATRSPKPPPQRISLGLRAINEARVVVFLIAGAGKAARLAQVHGQITSGAAVLPAARVQPTRGRLIWLLDTAAAGNLEESP